MSDEALQTYLAKWRDADPQRGMAWLFLRPEERIRFGALAALLAEWQKAIHEVREPQVAAVKLGWWREEMPRAVAGRASHPLTRSLFADPRVCEIPAGSWVAAVDAALLAIGASPAADFASQREAVRPLATAFADLETQVWFGPSAQSPRAAEVTLLGQLVSGTRALNAEIEYGRSPLPMNLLARHGLSIDALGSDGPARRAALRDQVQELHRDLANAAALPGPLGLFRAGRLQNDLSTLRRSRQADDPLPALRAPAHGFRSVLKTWRAARGWRAATH